MTGPAESSIMPATARYVRAERPGYRPSLNGDRMVEAICASCSWPVQPGDAFCPRCGHALAASPADDARRQPARETAARAAAAAREAAARASSAPEWPARSNDASASAGGVAPDVRESGYGDPVRLPPDPDQPVVDERHPLIAALLASPPAPASDPPTQPGLPEYLSPSVSHRTLGSIGGGRPSPNQAAEDATPADPDTFAPDEPAPIPPIPQRSAAAAAMVGTDVFTSRQPAALDPTKGPLPGPAGSRLMPASPPTGAQGGGLAALVYSNLRRLWQEMTDATPMELLTTGLTALGGALVLIAFFLPWSGANGIGIGTQATADNPAPANAWAFSSPAGTPLFLLFLVLGALILASDKLRELMPRFSDSIVRLTDVALPMLLGSVMLTVSFLYLTLPWGCGQGPSILGIGGALFLASGLVGLYRPGGAGTEAGS